MNNSILAVPGIERIPKDFEIVEQNSKFIKARRPDGLVVFFDLLPNELNLALNHIRVHGSQEEVILAVGFVRGIQIASNYAKAYGSEFLAMFSGLEKNE